MAIGTADPVRSEVRLTERLDVAFLLLDGVRRPRRARSGEVALCALGLDRDGQPRPLALRIVAVEDESAWTGLLRGLRTAGADSRLLLICCDGHPALLRAARAVFPGVPVQISIAHRLLSLAVKVDTRWRAACLAEARTIFWAPDRDTAVARFRVWRAHWLRDGHRAVQSLESDVASCLSFYRFPQALWSRIRTVNMVERVFREARQAVFAPEVAAAVAAPDAAPSDPAEDEPSWTEVQPVVHSNGADAGPDTTRPPAADPPSPNEGEQDVDAVPGDAAPGAAPWTRLRLRTDPRSRDLLLTVMALLTGIGLGLALTLLL